jgi:lambda family phage portal protein
METLNARTGDATRNGGFAKGGVQLHVDHIVGHQWKIVCKPNFTVLGIDPKVGREWAKNVEAQFTNYAEDPECWIDVERKRTLTMIARNSVHINTVKGEVFAKMEWMKKGRGRHYQTAVNLIDTSRICNPNELDNHPKLRAGVQLGFYGEALGYHVRTSSQADAVLGEHGYSWVYVPKQLKWGRMQMLHIFEPEAEGQTRGGNAFLSVLKKLPMLQKLQDATLQNAIVNAMYAAVIKSELDTETMSNVLGGETKGLANFMGAKADWHDATNIKMNGVKIPHLFPNEELSLLTAENPGQGFGDFEAAILREIAAGLNLSYEQLSRDFSKTNYASARAGQALSWKYFLGKRLTTVKVLSSHIFTCWLEEAIQKGTVKLPQGAPSFYEAKHAWSRCDWIGAGKPIIDGLKEVKEAVERLKAGLSTYEIEAANLGEDFQEIFEQQVREAEILADTGRTPLWAQEKGASQSETQEAPGTHSYNTDQD